MGESLVSTDAITFSGDVDALFQALGLEQAVAELV